MNHFLTFGDNFNYSLKFWPSIFLLWWGGGDMVEVESTPSDCTHRPPKSSSTKPRLRSFNPQPWTMNPSSFHTVVVIMTYYDGDTIIIKLIGAKKIQNMGTPMERGGGRFWPKKMRNNIPLHGFPRLADHFFSSESELKTKTNPNGHRVVAVWVRFGFQLGLRQTQALIIIYTMHWSQ